MPRYCATKSIVSTESQPFSSCATVSAAMTADCFWSPGYFATAASILASASGERTSGAFIARSLRRRLSSVDLSEHDILGADDRNRIGDHVAARHLVERGEVREPGRADLQAIRLVRVIGHEINAELAFR